MITTTTLRRIYDLPDEPGTFPQFLKEAMQDRIYTVENAQAIIAELDAPIERGENYLLGV